MKEEEAGHWSVTDENITKPKIFLKRNYLIIISVGDDAYLNSAKSFSNVGL